MIKPRGLVGKKFQKQDRPIGMRAAFFAVRLHVVRSSLAGAGRNLVRMFFYSRTDVRQQRPEAAEVNGFGVFRHNSFSEDMLSVVLRFVELVSEAKVLFPSLVPRAAASKKSSILAVF